MQGRKWNIDCSIGLEPEEPLDPRVEQVDDLLDDDLGDVATQPVGAVATIDYTEAGTAL